MKLILIAKALIIFSICCASGQSLKERIDSIAAEHFSEPSHVGLSIGVIANGVESQHYYGGKYVSSVKDVDSTTLFEIGSVTKLHTAFMFACLEREKRLSRFDLLAKYLPNAITNGKQWASKIRLVDLATHTSGLPSFDNTKSLMVFKNFDENNPYGLFSTEFMLSLLKSTDTLNNYGKVRYSNFGIGVLGYVMAKATNTTFETLFDKYIINNLNLRNTYYKVGEQSLTRMAIPHRRTEVMPLIQLADLSPSGSIKTTMPDLLRFLSIHLQKAQPYTDIINAILANQLDSGEAKVGLGWGIHDMNGETVYFHNGGTYGSSSIVILIPAKKAAVAIFANNHTGGELTKYALKLANILLK